MNTSMVSMFLNFVGSLVPFVFPDKEFRPKRLVAVLLIMLTLAGCIKFLGMDDTKGLVDLTEDVVQMTEE